MKIITIAALSAVALAVSAQAAPPTQYKPLVHKDCVKHYGKKGTEAKAAEARCVKESINKCSQECSAEARKKSLKKKFMCSQLCIK